MSETKADTYKRLMNAVMGKAEYALYDACAELELKADILYHSRGRSSTLETRLINARALLVKAKEAMAESAHQMRNEYPHTFEREIGMCEEAITDIEEVL